jgi:hypothetical protein
VRARALFLALGTLALAGCGDDPAPEDVPRFDARDAVVEETLDAPLSEVSGRFDVVPSIDVTPLGDLGTASDAGAPADVSLACQAVSEDYAAAVRDAQACRVDGECGARVCETLCCACEVFVDRGAEAFARLELLRERWAAMGCATMGRCVGGGGCGAAVAASCSAEGRCVTVRDPALDGGVGDGAVDAALTRDAGLDGAAR